MVVNVNHRRLVEATVLQVMASNAREIRKTVDYTQYAYGYNAMQLAVESIAAIELTVGSVAWHKAMFDAKQTVRAIVPIGYHQWKSLTLFGFVCDFTKLVVNGNWLPDPSLPKVDLFVQELFNVQTLEDYRIGSVRVEDTYRKAVARGLYRR